MRFSFAFDPRFEPLLFLLGATPRTAWVEVTDERFEACFGLWTCATDRANVKAVTRTGPYQWFRVIGTRVSLADRGLTFGTNTQAGLCVRFHAPVGGVDPLGLVRHPALTVTVAQVDRLAEALG
jgi:hypothetical protein